MKLFCPSLEVKRNSITEVISTLLMEYSGWCQWAHLIVSEDEEHLYEHEGNSAQRRHSQKEVLAAQVRFELEEASKLESRVDHTAHAEPCVRITWNVC